MKGQHVRETEWQAHPSFAADALSRSLQHNSVAPQRLRAHGGGRVCASKAEEPWPQVPQGLVSP